MSMTLNKLKDILYSTRDNILHCIIYDAKTFEDIEKGCSIEYAMENYGDNAITRITVDQGYLVIGIKTWLTIQ